MAKKFMYVCFGILALAVAFHLGAQYGSASIVDHSMIGIVAFEGDWGTHEKAVLLDNGEVWTWIVNEGRQWTHTPGWEPPVAVSEIKFWNWRTFISNNDEIWYKENESTPWQSYPAPGGAALTHPTTWGQIKAEFGE